MSENSVPMATPLVKWVGGKRQLQTQIIGKIREVFDPAVGTYFEPFFGGGAIFFALSPRRALASDLNAGLVNLYNRVTDSSDSVVNLLTELQSEYNSLTHEDQLHLYYKKRELFNFKDEGGSYTYRLGVEGAALFIFLNKAGFNGMYRENASGNFNIPFGKRDKINLFEDDNIQKAAGALKNLTVLNQDYRETVHQAKPGDLVYFDPPYAPLTKTSSFEGYNKENLGGFDQVALRDLVVELTRRGVHCLVSNSSAEIIEELYCNFDKSPLSATRAISASAAGRKRVKEYLIDNFKQVQG